MRNGAGKAGRKADRKGKNVLMQKRGNAAVAGAERRAMPDPFAILMIMILAVIVLGSKLFLAYALPSVVVDAGHRNQRQEIQRKEVDEKFHGAKIRFL